MHVTILTTALLMAAASLSAAIPTTPETAAIATTIDTTNLLDDGSSSSSSLLLNSTTNALHARGYVYNQVRLCEHANGGKCFTQAFRHGLCYNLDRKWNDKVSSVFPGPNTRCRLWRNRDCRGDNRGVGPNWGVADLKRIGWNDVTSSIDCNSQSAQPADAPPPPPSHQ